MNIITVIPLTRSKVGGQTGTLSYFTASEVPVGAVVSVPLRSKSIHAVVTDTRAAGDIKTEVRSAPYQIRKLDRVKANAFFPPSFVSACKVLADFYATNVGAVMNALVADAILENANKISPPLPLADAAPGVPTPEETYAVQGDDADRLSTWRSLIRQEFARKRSIALYVPTIEDGKQLFTSLEKGIEGYIFMLHSSLTPKKLIAAWETIATTDHPVVIIATGSFSVLPRSDIGTVVIERENGRGWLSPRAPYLDFRQALETFARKSRKTVYLADSMLRAETLHRLEEREIAEGSPFKWRSISTASDALVNMRRDPTAASDDAQTNQSNEAPAEKIPFRVLSPELEDLIRLNHEDSAHMFILSTRRGLSSVTVCSDCETIVTCRQCSSPVVLHTSKETGVNFFLCHKCGERRPADEQCANCGGWRLTPLGIGIDKVREEIAAKFPEMSVYQIDADSTKTETAVNEAVANFKAKPGSILLGTEMALPYLSEKVEHVAVASLDSLFALPDFRIQERVMYLLIRLRNIASRTLLVQTRRPEEKVFECGLKGNLSDFHHMVMDERRQFEYPPFSVLVKITMEGKKPIIAKEMGELQAFINPHEIEVFPAFTATVRGNSVIHGLVKIQPRLWPETELANKLRSLPPDVSVKVNPESLL
ncbi:MAG: hypothetical protein JWO00_359 [Candidatus Parcubacteria bacterium]|nr:hypothetical protein [Candidatus Parcubacteria bacterium]